MRYFDVSNLTFKHVQIFLAAAKYENFSAAAESLNVTQPLVSRTISLLEQELGFPLFQRGKRQVRLTAAGQVLQEQWRRLYTIVEKSLETAQRAHEASRSVLSIADDWISFNTQYLTPITSVYSARWPDVELRIDQMSPEDVVAAVSSGLCDVGFLMEPELVRLKGTDMVWRKLKESPFCADVSFQNPLSAHDSLRLQDFEGVPITLMSNTIASVYTKAVMDLFLHAGVSPYVTSYLASNSSLDFARANGNSGAIILNNFVPLMEGTKRIPIEGTKTSLALFWNRNNQSVHLANFVQVAAEVMDQMPMVLPLCRD